MRNNVNFKIDNFKDKRKGGGNCFAVAVSVKSLDTIELVELFVDMVADNYEGNNFEVNYDGIYNITIHCDNNLLYEGNVVEIENMFREGTYVFRDVLNKRVGLLRN